MDLSTSIAEYCQEVFDQVKKKRNVIVVAEDRLMDQISDLIEKTLRPQVRGGWSHSDDDKIPINILYLEDLNVIFINTKAFDGDHAKTAKHAAKIAKQHTRIIVFFPLEPGWFGANDILDDTFNLCAELTSKFPKGARHPDQVEELATVTNYYRNGVEITYPLLREA